MSRPTRSQLALLAILLTSVAINGLQGARILRLEAALEGRVLSSAGLPEGATLPPLEGRDAHGKAIVIAYNSAFKPTLLYVFSPSCMWCERNTKSFDVLASQTKEAVRLIGLSLSSDRLDPLKTESGIEIPVYSPSSSTMRDYRLGNTPTTILVSPAGVVLKVWSGAYAGATKKSVENYFRFSLPGL